MDRLFVPASRKARFSLSLTVMSLTNIPFVSGKCYTKWTISSGSSAKGATTEGDVRNNTVIWNEPFVVDKVTFILAKKDMKSKPCLLILSVKQVNNNSTREETLGTVTIDLAELADTLITTGGETSRKSRKKNGDAQSDNGYDTNGDQETDGDIKSAKSVPVDDSPDSAPYGDEPYIAESGRHHGGTIRNDDAESQFSETSRSKSSFRRRNVFGKFHSRTPTEKTTRTIKTTSSKTGSTSSTPTTKSGSFKRKVLLQDSKINASLRVLIEMEPFRGGNNSADTDSKAPESIYSVDSNKVSSGSPQNRTMHTMGSATDLHQHLRDQSYAPTESHENLSRTSSMVSHRHPRDLSRLSTNTQIGNISEQGGYGHTHLDSSSVLNIADSPARSEFGNVPGASEISAKFSHLDTSLLKSASTDTPNTANYRHGHPHQHIIPPDAQSNRSGSRPSSIKSGKHHIISASERHAIMEGASIPHIVSAHGQNAIREPQVTMSIESLDLDTRTFMDDQKLTNMGFNIDSELTEEEEIHKSESMDNLRGLDGNLRSSIVEGRSSYTKIGGSPLRTMTGGLQFSNSAVNLTSGNATLTVPSNGADHGPTNSLKNLFEHTVGEGLVSSRNSVTSKLTRNSTVLSSHSYNHNELIHKFASRVKSNQDLLASIVDNLYQSGDAKGTVEHDPYKEISAFHGEVDEVISELEEERNKENKRLVTEFYARASFDVK